MHFRKYFDSRFVGSWDFEGKPEVTLTMDRVSKEKVHNPETHQEEEKPVLYFKGANKGLVLNVTNASRIAAHHGSDTDQWPGKQVTLYATKVRFGSEMVDAVRVKEAGTISMPRNSK